MLEELLSTASKIYQAIKESADTLVLQHLKDEILKFDEKALKNKPYPAIALAEVQILAALVMSQIKKEYNPDAPSIKP